MDKSNTNKIQITVDLDPKLIRRLDDLEEAWAVAGVDVEQCVDGKEADARRLEAYYRVKVEQAYADIGRVVMAQYGETGLPLLEGINHAD